MPTLMIIGVNSRERYAITNAPILENNLLPILLDVNLIT